MSDESDVDTDSSFDVYKKKYKLLFERCEVLKQDNERLFNRIKQVKSLLKIRKKECNCIINRLDMHGDEWRTAPAKRNVNTSVKNNKTPPSVTVKIEKGINSNKPTPDRSKKKSKKKVTKVEKHEKDPNAPKRPANPFFQFCQEQRTIVMERLNSELKPGEPEPSKQELTRQLAIKWKTLSTEDKQIYVDMYEKSKEKYALEMDAYNCKN